jgi:S-adenosylmethionine hydrolase
MSPVITLTTDFGHKGPFVAVVKGVILNRAPNTRILDLTHEILAHWPAEAGFWLSRAYRYFPQGSLHLAIVDPGVGTERNIIAAEYDGHLFLAPDNGLLPVVFDSDHPVRIHRMSSDWHARQNWPEPSQTFHGRDIFAPMAAEMAAGRIRPEDIGPAVDDIVPSLLEAPVVRNNEIRGSVVTIDHFGNLITNIDAKLLTAAEKLRVRVAGMQLNLAQTYGNKQPGEFLALINSFGVVEVARAEGSAADSLGLGHGAPVIISNEASD